MVRLETHESQPLKNSRKALVIRLSSMGDVVLSTSALEPLRSAGFEVSFVTKKAFSPLLESHPGIKEIFSFDSQSESEAQAREKFFQWFDAQGFDLVLDLQDSWRTWAWRPHMRKHAEVFVARKERFREWMILFLRLGRLFSFGRGGRAKKSRRLAVDVLAANKIFAPSMGPLTQLFVTQEERTQVKSLLPKAEFAVFLPASAWKGKEWPYFPELAEVVSRKIPIVTLGSEKDEVCDEVVKRAVVGSGSISFRGKTNLRQSMSILSEAKWVIGNDTGMVHVAEALGKDVAMIEGPTHSYLGFSPHKEKSIILGLDLVCRPCSKSGRFCPRFGTRKCLSLSVQEVSQQLRRWGLPC